MAAAAPDHPQLHFSAFAVIRQDAPGVSGFVLTQLTTGAKRLRPAHRVAGCATLHLRVAAQTEGSIADGGGVDDSQARIWDEHVRAIGLRRDRAAFATLFAHFAPRLKSMLVRSGLTPDAAEEIVQDAFIAVWRQAHTFDAGKAGAATWIFAIARNRRIDAFRRNGRPAPDPNDPAFTPDAPAPGDAALTQRQRAARIRAAMDVLPPEQRDVLLRAYFAEHSHTEIARDLHAPVGTVKSRLRLALRRLREVLKDEMEEGFL